MSRGLIIFGIVLIAIVLTINAAAWGTRLWSERQAV